MGKNPRRTFIDKLIRKPDRSDQQLVLTPKGCTSSTSACAAQADADVEEKCPRDEKRIAPDTILPPIIMSSKDGHDAVNATAADTTTGVRQEHQYELEQLPMSTPPEDPGSGLGADPDNSKPQRSKLRMFAIMVALSVSHYIFHSPPSYMLSISIVLPKMGLSFADSALILIYLSDSSLYS